MTAEKRPVAIVAPHSKTCEQVLAHFKVSMEKGLSSAQVAKAKEKYGPNELDHEESKSIFTLILEQFEDLLVRILLAAAIVSFLLAYFDESAKEEGLMAFVEPFVILLILIANAFVGVWQESNAEAALEALKKLQPELAQVLRDGHWQSIQATDLVPGDIVEVSVGDKVPADMRLLQLKTTTLRIEQSQLTGESESVSKDTDPITETNCEIQSKLNLLFASTTVSNGSCVSVVVGTGMNTEIGEIQSAVQEAGEEESQTPLQKKIEEFGELLAKVIFFICAVVWIINYRHFFDPVHGSTLRGCIYYFKIAVALAVAAIPEGLPAVITTCLALGTRKMAKRNSIVRRLPSVETLGCTTVICSDKTGTLTTNEMCCVRFSLPLDSSSMREFSVGGTSYRPLGNINGLRAIGNDDVALQTFAKIAAICNSSRISVDKVDPERFIRAGEPTEAALRVLVEKMGCPEETLNKRCLQAKRRAAKDAMVFSDYWKQSVETQATLEFSRDRKSMSVLVREEGKKQNSLFVKGAPESVLERCGSILLPSGKVVKLTDQMRTEILNKQVTPMAKEALRTLALAIKYECGDLSQYTGGELKKSKSAKFLSDPANFIKAESDLVFVGLVGIQDPPRPECKVAIEECRQAGISVIMITGDNKQTAEAIAKDLRIIPSGLSEAQMAKCSLTGREFEALSDTKKRALLQGTDGAVFSRTEPKHKQIIVKILKDLGEITAMTGDGVNDAPALKQADIGVAMGITGTEVAKEAADMILTDDNFSTIVHAVEEGRSIYNNMKAFIRYLISSNIGEVASIFFTAALGIPEGLAPVQLLWVNLVTDGLPATALGFNPPDMDVMLKPPRKKDDALISGWVFFRYMVVGLYVGLATVGVFVYWYVLDSEAADQHSLVSLEQLMNWETCSQWQGFSVKPLEGMPLNDPCSYFTVGKTKASTLSLTVLVVIEMLNALNALSEEGSLLQMPPWANPWLILAICGSVLVHFFVLYQPLMAQVFGVVPLDLHDWELVMYFSLPVILIDEVMKFFGRMLTRQQIAYSKRL